MVDTCTVCMDNLETDRSFQCWSEACEYKLCQPCVRRAFEDLSGSDSKHCPLCKSPMARAVLETIVGRGAVQAVEDQLRPKLEFDMQAELERREKRKEDMTTHKDKALVLFNDLCEQLNMKCPRCNTVFYDYDGYNALRCGSGDCGAAFCAICLLDCGQDAHVHARSHGDLFERSLFENARKIREAGIISSFMGEIERSESFDVQQLVKNMHHATFAAVSDRVISSKHRASAFLQRAKNQLQTVIRNDRRSILTEAEDLQFTRRGFRFGDISPRSSIPEEYKLELEPRQGHVFAVALYEQDGINAFGEKKWKNLELDFFDSKVGNDFEQKITGNDQKRRIDSLVNIKQALRCGVIAVEGSRTLYQTRLITSVDKGKDQQLSVDEISIGMFPITPAGEVSKVSAIVGRCRVIGINQNLRYLLLAMYVAKTDDEILMFDALKEFIRAKPSRKVFHNIDIAVPAPDTFDELNAAQKEIAHPLALMTATEVAGPPGTGKTKTIAELIRCLLDCTNARTIVISERNGAIDAIAEKFVYRCLKLRTNGIHRIKDIMMWNNLLVYGSDGALGPSAQMFTLNSKLR